MTFVNNLKGYEVRFLAQARKDLDELDKKAIQKITQKLKELITGSQNLDIKKLQGKKDTYRLRYADYRIIYTIEKHILVVLVVEVSHRREVYRD